VALTVERVAPRRAAVALAAQMAANLRQRSPLSKTAAQRVQSARLVPWASQRLAPRLWPSARQAAVRAAALVRVPGQLGPGQVGAQAQARPEQVGARAQVPRRLGPGQVAELSRSAEPVRAAAPPYYRKPVLWTAWQSSEIVLLSRSGTQMGRVRRYPTAMRPLQAAPQSASVGCGTEAPAGRTETGIPPSGPAQRRPRLREQLP
jgi:hypothetical protein